MSSSPAQHHDRNQPFGPLSIFFAMLSVTLWGGTAVANQYAIDALPPIFVGGLRFGMAAIFMWGWCWWRGDPLLLTGSQWGRAFILGIFLFAQITTFNIGISETSSSHASILVNSYVFWVAAIEHFVQRAIRLNGRQLLGLLLAGTSSAILILTSQQDGTLTSRDTPTFAGNLWVATSGLILGLKIIYVRHATRHVPPGPLVLWHDVFGTTMFFILAAFVETITFDKVTHVTIWALLFGGFLVSGFCFAANAWLLQRHPASQVSVFSFFTPVCGVIAGVLMRGDRMTPWVFLSGACVAAGIVLVNYERRPKAI